jgi:hypothetical protein
MHHTLAASRNPRQGLPKSLPTPNIQELLRVVTRLAVGAPRLALLDAVAPTAPAPLVPDGSVPANAMTVMEANTF